ncbi:MAG: nuclear transport factor 2 family protein [Bacteroidota bacterium]
MNKGFFAILLLGLIFTACQSPGPSYEIAGPQSQTIADMIEAVNEKNAEKYVKGFAEDVQVFVASEMKINGREALQANRANHFQNHPEVKSKIQHLVEIDERVILHDKVWLDESDQNGQDIVEIFTFENGAVVRVDVIQPENLFRR